MLPNQQQIAQHRDHMLTHLPGARVSQATSCPLPIVPKNVLIGNLVWRKILNVGQIPREKLETRRENIHPDGKNLISTQMMRFGGKWGEGVGINQRAGGGLLR